MKVFVSSTCFDLIDMRVEVADFLRSCGIVPVLSDDNLSDFKIEPDKNSIETCLVNVDACDEMIVILDKRYGPRLGAYGYENVSATHLEYRRFLPTRKQIHFFVRNKLEGDYAIWKKNGKNADLEFSWVEKKDVGLFDFLEERRQPTTDKDKPNWFTTFISSADLKAGLTKYYDEALLPERLAEAVYSNNFPLFHITITKEDLLDANMITLNMIATNTGSVTALNFILETDKDNPSDKMPSDIGPQQVVPIATSIRLLYDVDSVPIYIEYETLIGIKVREKHTIYVKVLSPTDYSCSCVLNSRDYVKCKKPTFKISDK